MLGRSLALLALLALACQNTDAFTPASFRAQKPFVLKMAVTSSKDHDVSVPYDAAARLAYDAWCDTYGKEANETRFAAFKANYEAITVANIKAKKAAVDAGVPVPTQLSLNQFGDFTAEEYQEMQSGGAPPSDVFKGAMEAAMSQSEAASALEEAAGALAEEEQNLAEQLGMGSVEEMEAALDAMEGIADDGGELSDNLVREARVRASYIGWCKENGKEADEMRFQVFMSNFLAMEEYAKESGKQMTLNKYADCTEEEYVSLTSPAATLVLEEVPEAVVEKEAITVADTSAEDAKAEAVAAAEKAKSDEAAAQKAKSDEAAAQKAQSEEAEAKASKAAKAEEVSKKQTEAAAKKSLSASELDASNEKDRKDRQAAQENAAEKLRLENEAAAIAASKEIARNEAAQVAKRRENEAKAAEIAREKAKDYDSKQAKIAAASVARYAPPAPSPKKAPVPKPFLGSIIGNPKPVPAPMATSKTVPPKPAPVTKPAPQKESAAFDFGSIFASPEPAKKELTSKSVAVPKPATKPAKQAPPAKKAEPFSFFGKTAPSPSPKPAQVVAPKPAPAATKVEPFSFFGSATPVPAPKPAQVVAPKPVPAAKKADSFSFFGSSKSAPAKNVQSTPVPVAKKAEPFSFFGSAKPAPAPKLDQAVVPKVAPVKNTPFSFFGSSTPASASISKASAPKPAPVGKKIEPRSFFGSPKPIPAPKVAPAPVITPTPPKPLFSFGSAPKAAPPAPPQKKVMQPMPMGRGTIAIKKAEEPKQKSRGFFGGSKNDAAPQDDIPVLSRFVQNDDGSITGVISNSKSYRTGTRITTSPVKRGVMAGTVVKTSSGSQYRLK